MIPYRIKSALWQLGYARWPRVAEPVPGYTLLFTVPPDLPVFLVLAVEICRRQDLTGLVETLVVPDRLDVPFRRRVDDAARSWPEGMMRLVEPSPLDRLVRPFLRVPSMIHWLQLVAGVRHVRSTHAVVHDVDLFMLEDGFLRSLFEHCREDRVACVGNAAPWQGNDWATDPRFAHVVALWELMFDLEWMRAGPPARMRPQRGRFGADSFWFETTLLAQARTAPERIARHRPAELVHFGWVVGGYRTFQRSKGPFEDDQFRLLLIRLLIDAFDAGGAEYEVPTLADLERGLTDADRRVFYGAAARGNYATFRTTLDRLLTSDLFPADRIEVLRAGLAPFDAELADGDLG